jgi:hypothetical protein
MRRNNDPKGGINVNEMGCWATMQQNPMASINFESTDNAIKLFQRHGFSLTWYWLSDAPWAFPNKPDCQPGTIETPFGERNFYRACAPEPDFEKAWINYVKAIVERYDGDGINDMPGLTVPVQFYIQQGEIKFGIGSKGGVLHIYKSRAPIFRHLLVKLGCSVKSDSSFK